MFMFRVKNARQNHDIKKIRNKSFENETKLKYLEITAVNRNYTDEQIKCKLNFGKSSRNIQYRLLHLPFPIYKRIY
jgi:hypothetical protein